MKNKLSSIDLKKYSRQIVLKDVGIKGQEKIKKSKVIIIGLGGLGSPIADLLTRAGVGLIGLVDKDKVDISNIHRQTLYETSNIGLSKVITAKKKLNAINKNVKIKTYNLRAKEDNLKKILKDYDIIVDGSDNFETKFLLNKYSLKFKKKLVVGAISKFDGHLFTFNFNSKIKSCLKCFYQSEPSDEILNCESEGILGTTASIMGSLQASEIIKLILGSENHLESKILIVDLLNVKFRKVLFKKKRDCICKKY